MRPHSIQGKVSLPILLAILAVIMAAAGGGWWWQQHKRDAAPEGATVFEAAGGPFALSGCDARTSEDAPALALIFSEPLDRKTSLDKLITVTDLGRMDGATEQSEERGATTKPPAKENLPVNGKIVSGGWYIGDNPRVALFAGVQPQRKYHIQLSAEIQSRAGVKLAEAGACDVATEEMPPSFFFASKGTVLPAKQNGGLPVVTINVPEVDVQFLRVEPAQLPRFIEKVLGVRAPKAQEAQDDDATPADTEEEYDYRYGYDGYYGESNKKLKGRVYNWDLERLREVSQSVYLGRFPTDDKPNRRHVTFLPVENIKELQEPGIYVAVMSQPGRFREDYQVTYFYVSDIGVHVHRFDKQTELFATSLTTGKALSGIEFEVLDANAKSLGKTASDGEGRASLPNLPESAQLLLAQRGKEMSVLALHEPGLDLSEFDVGGYLPRDAKLFVYAGRDLYRPGEKFAVSMLARDPDGRIAAPLPVQARLKRPDGRTVQTETWQPDSKIPGYFQRTLSLPADAQTGRWTLELRADPGARAADSVWTFQVEEFLPERMKLDLRNDQAWLAAGDAFAVSVQGDYLYGAPAAGNRLLGSVAVERARNPLAKQWPGFVFGDVADDKLKAHQEIDETALDDKGQAQVNVPIAVDAPHSLVSVRASFSLLESGGRPVVRSIERVLWPAKAMLAVRPAFDRDVAQENSLAQFELIRVDPKGNFAPSKEVSIKLFREDRVYYWRFDDQKGWHSGYTETEELLESGKLALAQRSPLSLGVKWGTYRLEVADPETGQTLRYRFYAGWNAQDAEAIGNRPDRVQMKLEGVPAKPGGEVKLTLVPPHDGEALILVEGDRVLWSKRMPVSTSGTTVSIPLNEKWNRSDLYVSAIVFRPGSQGDRVTPARAVGLAYLPLARAERKLAVQISAPDKVLPEKRTIVKVKAEGAAGKLATVTLSAVDIGILNITRYKTPDAFDFFFGKHRYAPELLDLYGKLIEKMDGTRGKLKWGGDAGMRDTRSMPKKVKLVDLFSGPVQLDAKGEAQIPLDIPDFNGTLRLMAVAATPERFGSAEREMTVAAPIVAELSMPRFIAPGDSATLALDVTNMSGGAQDIQLKLEAADPVKIRDGERSLSLKDKQRTILRFPVEATDAYGLGRIRLQLKGSGAKPISITREMALQVQPPVPAERELRRARIEPNGSFKLDPAMLERFFKASATVSMTVSNKPPLNVKSLVQGLLDYPYGCLEQTTSAAYPYVFIDEAAAKAYGLKPRSREERAQFIEGAIARIASMQGAQGGYTLWGGGAYEAWLTPYVSGFLADARAEGFNVPDAMMKRAQDWMLQRLQNAPNNFPSIPASVKPDDKGHYRPLDYDLLRNGHQRFAELAHIAYMLARDQKAPLASLRVLHDQFRDRAKSPLPLVHLAAALEMMGDKARAKVALDDAMKRPYGIDPGYWGWEWLGDYGSATRDYALAYALMMRHKLQHPRRENMLFDLTEKLGNRGYASTQERLALFLAARAAGGESNAEWSAALKKGATSETLASRSTELRSFDAAALARGLEIENRSNAPLFLEIEATGYPVKAPAPKTDVVELTRDWFEPDGSRWNGRPLKTGDMLIVRLTAVPKRPLDQGLIVDHVPAGFEIENLNLSQGPHAEEFTIGNVNVAQAMQDPRIRHREFRDDRFVVAAELKSPMTVFYMLRAVTPGRYVVPAPFAEDMYRPELRGIGVQPQPVTVVDPRAPAAAPAAPASAPAEVAVSALN
ncbi:MAG: alpha-2-macroglobulin family protein [Betaproteobacteria bacterium]|nr:alpha-2-macroglobulin family protein [Betaproteobacteria bacterium]